ncbi:alanine--tRNA ligase [Patescibacteria group bacterium]
MTSDKLRQEFLDFFKKRGHKIVPSSSLLPKDPTVLFTSAGMQQFKEYFLGKKSPYGKMVVSCQKCFRTSDIEEVGDDKHLTFLEMLGNFSFGEYFKEEAIKLSYEFIFETLKLPKENATFTVFKGDSSVPVDKESILIWKKLGIPESKIKKCGREDNFWGPTGKEGPCGPTTEIYFKGIEVWNLVFNEFYQDSDGKLIPLKQKGVDTGMGLERLAMTVQKKPSVFETDLFLPIINGIPGENEKAKRIIADHVKSSVFLISEGVVPSNIERGYILRRVLRRGIRYGKVLNLSKNFLIPLAQKTIEIYKDVYPELQFQQADILTVIQNEEEKFEKTLDRALKILHTHLTVQDYIPGKRIENIPDVTLGFTPKHLTGKWLFNFYQNFGLPLELSLEELKIVDKLELERLKREFTEELKKHQEISRVGAQSKFGGGGEFSPQLHTVTHLLHASLREVLGNHVKQMGSDITPQRLRFDFSHLQKMTKKEIKEVENLVNQKIKQDLVVKKEEMNYKEALETGALAFFKEKYPEKVSVFSILDPSDSLKVFSKEICAGPHVDKTSELGFFKIKKEESSGAGIRRIRAILE